jgi:hypothetical protein
MLENSIATEFYVLNVLPIQVHLCLKITCSIYT